MTYHGKLRTGRNQQLQAERIARIDVEDGRPPMAKSEIEAKLIRIQWKKLWKAFDQHVNADDPTYRALYLAYTPPPPQPTASEGAPPQAPREIVPLSKAAPPEPQAGEDSAQEEARESEQTEAQFIEEYITKQQAKKPKADYVIVTSSHVPPPLKTGSKQQLEAMKEVLGMIHMLPSEIKAAHGPTGRAMVESSLHAMTFCLDALKAMPLSELDQGAWRSVLMAHRAKIDAAIAALKQEAKTS